VKEYNQGDYFGELALLNSAPRAATVIAQGNVSCLTLTSDAFKRLLGGTYCICTLVYIKYAM
jgi:cAMP-dependent protein kinase regulator